ncbi:MAG: hypothetical protein AAFX09_00695 [Pseudomonadota bacterium]
MIVVFDRFVMVRAGRIAFAWRSFIVCLLASALVPAGASASEFERTNADTRLASYETWTRHVAERARSGQSSVIIMGEVHGSEESPRFIGNLVDLMAYEGARVSLLLEVKARYSPVIEPQPTPTAARDRVCGELFDLFANNRMGYSSVAISALLESGLVRMHQEPGFNLRFIDGSDGRGNAGRHQAMARIITEEMQRSDVVIALLGRYHPPRVKTRLEAMDLPRDSLVMTLRQQHPGGEVWNCTQHGCGLNAIRGPDVDQHAQWASLVGTNWHGGLVADNRPDDAWFFSGHYDALVLLEAATPSPPVFETDHCTDVWWGGDIERAALARGRAAYTAAR